MIAALIILYNAEPLRLRQVLCKIVNQVDVIIVVDNRSANFSELVRNEELLNQRKVKVIKLQRNMGIAAAQNTGMKLAERMGIRWVLTLDQDSLFPYGGVAKFKDSQAFKLNDCAIIAADFSDEGIGKAASQTLERETMKQAVISSGNLVRVSAWKRIGGFDDSLFIDNVDYDFDFRLSRAGYSIWQINTVRMEHQLGTPVRISLWVQRLLRINSDDSVTDHPPFRQYYFYRNSIILIKRYPEQIEALEKAWHTSHLYVSLLLSMRRNLVYSPPRVLKLIKSMQGYAAGLKYNPAKDISFNSLIDCIDNIDDRNSLI